ncbi:MAG: DUF1816 domain-containing protein [Xenococcaceae cyanobacterium MO_188.B19]|nr:DUF1816 domain-containing protein [Xenococcaceae cyanobacterium MO_188.B19]MDJ0679638.1 DUF1816 domain-containing protein [Xenococcaceae cyanobacterium MO_167.B52]
MNQKTEEFGWWIKIVTDAPLYIYYFGTFESYSEALKNQSGYIEDLKEEGNKILNIGIQKCQPKKSMIAVTSSRT